MSLIKTEKNKYEKKMNNNNTKLKKVDDSNNPDYYSPGIQKYNTLEKIIKLQEDLKIVSSIKQQFEENQKKMIEKMDKFCYDYYKTKIDMTQIFDYCNDDDAEQNYEYKLLTTEQAKQNLTDDIYNNTFSFLFLIRNDNNLLLKILEYCDKESYENISDFLVNYFYEDTINISFIQENLLIIIYLLIEKCIIKNMPKKEEIKKININDINLYEEYFKQNILYFIFMSLVRKIDIRNYLCSILIDTILKIENLRSTLAVEIGNITQELDDKVKDKNKNKRKMLLRFATYRPTNDKNDFVNKSPNFSPSKKKKSLLSNINEQTNTDIKEKLLGRMTLQNPSLLFGKEKKEEKKEEKQDFLYKAISNKTNYFNVKKFKNLNLGKNRSEKIEKIDENEDENIDKYNEISDPFFKDTDTTLEYIKNTLKEYEECNENNILYTYDYNNNTFIAMREYLKHLIDDMNSDEIKFEKYSNTIFVNSLMTSRNLKGIEFCGKLVDNIKKNYQIIVEIIRELLDKIKENINSMPIYIKSISNCIDVLLTYKYKNNLSLYSKYMIKANFIFGNIILPIFENPNYNGIITNEVISSITKVNLKLIRSIFNKMLAGQLFTIGVEPCMTIFNQFIIEILPTVFEIVQNIEQNFKLPEIIKGLTKTITDIDNEKRCINYNYFSENTDEILQFQSICFSYTNIINIIKALTKYKENNKEETNDIINNNIGNENVFVLLLKKEDKLNQNYKEYIYISKIKFKETLEIKIKSILKDYFVEENSPKKEKFQEEEISRFKRCLSEVLTYVNLIHKEYIPKCLYVKKENYIHDQNIIEFMKKTKKLEKYEKIIKKHKIREFEDNNEEDPNFKTEILPKIMLKVKSELGLISSDDSYQRMLYCCSYLQLHINLLPANYIKNNYELLFIELIKDTESNIHILRNNILNQLNIKIRGSEKTNLIMSNTYQQIKNMEKLKCIQYLYSKIELPTKFTTIYSIEGKNLIKNVTYEEKDKTNKNIDSLYESIPSYRRFEQEVEDIIELEEKTNMGEALNNYFKNLKNAIKKENFLVKKYSKDEIENISNDLENYILITLYEKLYPLNPTKEDIKFYKKCCRLDFVKPDNIIKDKNIVNENLWKTSMYYINEMDNKYAPADKIKSLAKAFSILHNSITFNSGKNELGVDDTIKPLIYIVLKSQPKKIFTNFNYCQLYLNPELSKKQYGILLTQICMIMNIIKDMKYTDLIGVTEEQFGKDDE